MKYWSHLCTGLQLLGYQIAQSSMAGFAETSGCVTQVLTQSHGLREGQLGNDQPLGEDGSKILYSYHKWEGALVQDLLLGTLPNQHRAEVV